LASSKLGARLRHASLNGTGSIWNMMSPVETDWPSFIGDVDDLAGYVRRDQNLLRADIASSVVT